MFDLQKKKWSKKILDYLEINENHLPKSFKPGTLLGKISQKASEQCGLKEGLPIYAAGGDGQLAGLVFTLNSPLVGAARVLNAPLTGLATVLQAKAAQG